MTFDKALSTILKRVDPFWEGRIHSMLVASSICKRGSFPAEINGIRVNPDWPRKGSITLSRKALWTPRDSRGKQIGDEFDILLPRIGYSGASRPETAAA